MVQLGRVKKPLFKSIAVTFFFALSYFLYNIELVRSHVEDIGFDITSKILFDSREEKTDSPKLMVFGFDDSYMKRYGLNDAEGESNFGYLFPRDHIARFIENLDDLCEEIAPENYPAGLFIDYDFSFTSMPYGKTLSKEDALFLQILKHDRPYPIYLPKTEKHNFIESSNDPVIQRLIAEHKIIFVSVMFLTSNDGVTRRYRGYTVYNEANRSIFYPSVDIALRQSILHLPADPLSIRKNFTEADIISNRLILKSYKNEHEEDGCTTSYSYWDNYTKYSADCSLFEIAEEDFSNAVIMLGGTYSDNTDNFSVFDIGNSDSLKGIELHANALMSIFYFNGQLKKLSFWPSVALVFSLYFLVDFFVGLVFGIRLHQYEKLHFTIVWIFMIIIMFSVSAYLLVNSKIWFNWFVPVILLEIFDILHYIKTKASKFKADKRAFIRSTVALE